MGSLLTKDGDVSATTIGEKRYLQMIHHQSHVLGFGEYVHRPRKKIRVKG
jgi:hypothetical protein